MFDIRYYLLKNRITFMEKIPPATTDAEQREAALDPTRSFIVQAPAGSGKTELLIQRFLKLLATVSAPEEIVAITFTRKAAAEMRNRVLGALKRAGDSNPPEAPHAKKTWTLATAVLKQDERNNWEIAQNPLRLKIQTIDSLCAGLTRQMPYLSRFGAQPEITDRPEALYREAARNTVADLEAGARWSRSIEELLRYTDNYLARVESLVASMLARRDQWLRHTAGAGNAADQRERLEQALVRVIEDALKDVKEKFPSPGRDILLAGARFASENLKKDNSDSLICFCEDLADLPGTQMEDVKRWLGLAELLLTKDGEWRKAVNKNIGFPAPSSAKNDSLLKQQWQEKKDEFFDFLQRLNGEDSAAEALVRVRMLPDPAYTDDQWQIMQALFEILTVAVGHLELVFKDAGAVDFAEIGLRAAAALGGPENPTDLSLALDYRISHILMDEFQDTSFSQYELVERLTAGWTPGDGRTFFAVGDPMQSIYAFREAEVGLFLNAWEKGLSNVDLHPLTLSVNFRSRKGIIDWVNDSFARVMPETRQIKADITTGRVAYSPSTAFHPALAGDAVQVHPFLPSDREREAQQVVKCVQKAKKEHPDDSIAILVRARSHLEDIVAALKSSGERFQAVEIDSLGNRPVITDLISLSRALSHPADRVAWLAVLRAPWCGMTLTDLFHLVDGAPGQTVLSLMQSPEQLKQMSKDGQKRLMRISGILVPAVENRLRKPFRRLVEGVWTALGGPGCVYAPHELEDVGVFFSLLDRLAGGGIITDISALEDAAAALFAGPDAGADDKLQIMTIHKAKGLEFDTVILPGLERTPPAASHQLLLWLERATDHHKDLLLAPISETGTDKSRTYEYIRKIHEEKKRYEDARLLYVAATRARKNLHIMAGVNISAKDQQVRQPASSSLLSALWPAVGEIYYKMGQTLFHDRDRLPPIMEDNDKDPVVVPYIRRFGENWQLPDPPPDVFWKTGSEPSLEAKEKTEKPEFDWAGETARSVGTVAHSWLRVIAEQGLDQWDVPRIQSLGENIKQDLARSGFHRDEMDAAVSQVVDALTHAVTHDKGRWILSRHAESACEYGLTGVLDGQVVSVKIDRTFVDENNVRWIIDFKTGTHRGGSLDEFLDREKLRYQEQLETYRRLMGAKEDREIKLGLYFPQVRGWRSW